MNNYNDKLPTLWTILSNAVPPIGFLLYFKHRNQFPKKARTALINGIIGIPIALIGGYLLQTYVLK